MTAGRRIVRFITSPDLWLFIVAVLFLGVRTYFLFAMLEIPELGDEAYQMGIVRDGFDIGRGTFMPGIGFYISAFYAYFDQITTTNGRVIIGVTGALLTLVAALMVRATFGRWYAVVFLFALIFATGWNIVSFTLWGEYLGSVFLIVNFLYMYWLFDRILAKERVNPLHYLLLVIIFAASLYVRQNFLVFPLVALALSLIVFAVLYFTNGERRYRLFLVPLVFVVGMASLAPWSVALSRHVGGFRISPMSQELSVAIHYGYPRLMERVYASLQKQLDSRAAVTGKYKKATDLKANTFLLAHRAVQYEAKIEKRPPIEVYKEYRSDALKDLTAMHALTQVKGSWSRFLFGSGRFSERFMSNSHWLLPLKRWQKNWVQWPHQPLFVGAFLLALAVTIIPFWGTLREQLLVVAYKGMFCFACLHPFVHRTNSRHHLFVVPFMILGALLLFRECYRIATRSSFSQMAAAEKVLFFAQAAGGLVVLSLGLVIAFYPV